MGVLMQYKNPWGYSNQELLTLYRGATADNECPMMVEKNLPSCGKSRFGWSLALCSKKKLPVIIDTPLSRLDSAHRESLIKTYFPYASEQTIILSTDSEINQEYHDMMKDDIGDEFTLVYDDISKSTTIQKGYFAEVEA